MCSSAEEVVAGFTSYFQNIFTTSYPNGILEYLDGLHMKVTNTINAQFTKWEFTKEEVYVEFSQMGPLKSPGSDGLLVAFYHEHWPTIGDEVCNFKFFLFRSF
jgi:hypothetical protein